MTTATSSDRKAPRQGAEAFCACARCGTQYLEPVQECDWCPGVKPAPIAAAGVRMVVQSAPGLAWPLAQMQQDMNDLGFGEAKDEPLGNFDRCDYGLPCVSTTTGCAKGQCARRQPMLRMVSVVSAPALTASALG